jgi:mono/diheme cytochrome c family protein
VVVKDTNGDGVLDVTNGDKAGVSCAVCHAVSDGSIAPSPNNLGGGGIGHELDGLSPHNLNVGTILATAANSRAYYPLLQLALQSNGGATIGRAPTGLTPTSTEAEVDAYLTNPAYYPLGSFDDAPDGVGAPQHIAPFFRTDLSAPYGAPGNIAVLDNFANLVYTALLDPTTLVTPGGRLFLRALGGDDAGEEIADGYVRVLTATGVMGPGGTDAGTGFPFVQASLPAGITAGSEAAPLGVRVNSQELLDMNAYTDSLRAPAAPSGLDPTQVAAGLAVFRSTCTACHNVNQSIPVPGFVVAEKTIFPPYNPTVLLQRPVEAGVRPVAFDPIRDDPSTIFDDKTVIIDASERMPPDVRGSALPLLLDLARKDRFLHDSEVVGLDSLMDPARGQGAPHPFFVSDSTQRAEVVAFLKSLDDTH